MPSAKEFFSTVEIIQRRIASQASDGADSPVSRDGRWVYVSSLENISTAGRPGVVTQVSARQAAMAVIQNTARVAEPSEVVEYHAAQLRLRSQYEFQERRNAGITLLGIPSTIRGKRP